MKRCTGQEWSALEKNLQLSFGKILTFWQDIYSFNDNDIKDGVLDRSEPSFSYPTRSCDIPNFFSFSLALNIYVNTYTWLEHSQILDGKLSKIVNGLWLLAIFAKVLFRMLNWVPKICFNFYYLFTYYFIYLFIYFFIY